MNTHEHTILWSRSNNKVHRPRRYTLEKLISDETFDINEYLNAREAYLRGGENICQPVQQ
jgi:hypothetical protein